MRFIRGELGKQIKKQWDRKESKEEIKIKGEMFRNIYERQVRENETAVKGKLQQSNDTKETKQRFLEKAKIVKQKLQMNNGYKTGTCRKESLIQLLHDVILRINEWNKTRMWGWRSEDSQQMRTGYKITNFVLCVIHIHIPIYHFNQTSIDSHENR